MRRMSTRCQPAPRWGWLLLLGGLTACGNDLPWASPSAAAGPIGAGRGEAGEGTGREPGAIDPRLETIQAEGAFVPRFVDKGYGAAWSFKGADLNGDGTDELLYGGQSVVAVGADEKPLWIFDLPPAKAMPTSEKPGERQGYGRPPLAEDKDKGKDKDQADEAGARLQFFGVHVRDMRAVEGVVFVLDSADRVHQLDAKTGELLYTQALGSEGNACELALFDADGDGVVDYFPSGGKTAYSGKDGKPVWEADVDFTPSIVAYGNLDATRGRELLLIEGASSARGDICPNEMNALAAMHDGMKDAIGEESKETKASSDAKDVSPSEAGGDIAAYGAGGDKLFEANVDADITTVLLADLDGDRQDEIVLATEKGLTLLDDTGNVTAEIPVEGRIDTVRAVDMNADEKNDLLVNAHDDQGSTLYGYSAKGEALWNAPLGARAYTVEAMDLDGDGAKELLTGLGYAGDEPGVAPTVAWRIGANGPEELWRAGGRIPARGYARIEGQGPDAEPRLYIAGGDAVVTGVAPDTGRMIGTWAAGSMNHDMATGDLDGDGKDEIITGDVFGHLVVTGGNGERMFDAELDSAGAATITGIAIAAPEGDNPGYFVVSGYAWRGADAGILEAYDADGNKLFATTTQNGLARVKLADLDGDGAKEIVVADFTFRLDEARGLENRDPNREVRGTLEPSAGEQCGVMAYDRDGNALWNTEVSSCDIAQIAVGDIDGDGSDEIAYGDLGRNGPFHVALLDGEGNLTWDITSDTDDAAWLEIIDDGVAYGGRSDDKDGHVTVLAAQDGKERWRADLRGKEAPQLPGMEDSPFGAFAGSLFGQKLADINGDGKMDLAFTTTDGEVMVMDGQNGDSLFEAKLQDAAMEGQADRRPMAGEGKKDEGHGQQGLVGGPLAYVKGTEGQPGYLVVTGYDFAYFDTHAVAFDLDSGEVVGQARLDELVAGVQGASWARGGEGVVIATTFDTYAFDLAGKRTPLPGRGEEGYDQGDRE
jgi:outer membrane protein assembly factor BamB